MSKMNTVDLGAISDASDDARATGTGFLRILADGTMERLDPMTVLLRITDPDLCDCGMSSPCMDSRCGHPLAPSQTES